MYWEKHTFEENNKFSSHEQLLGNEPKKEKNSFIEFILHYLCFKRKNNIEKVDYMV